MLGYGVLFLGITKRRYGVLKFCDGPFNSFDFSKFKFCLIKLVFVEKDLAPRRIPKLESSEERYVPYTESSVP
jgi:hypothetical protein